MPVAFYGRAGTKRLAVRYPPTFTGSAAMPDRGGRPGAHEMWEEILPLAESAGAWPAGVSTGVTSSCGEKEVGAAPRARRPSR